jgi:hypothetical protein
LLLIGFRQAAALGRLARFSPKPICWLRMDPQPVMSTAPTTDYRLRATARCLLTTSRESSLPAAENAFRSGPSFAAS